jgi:3-oxoadipate enol-lactonase
MDSCPVNTCPAAPSFSVAGALRQFEQHAVHGICLTGSYNCSYFVWGNGPPLLFIHGMGDTGRGYVPVISLLASQFRCIAYSLPGVRGDGVDLDRVTHASLVRDVATLLDHLEIPQAYLFGSSLGATVGLGALHAYPRRIPRAILAGGFAMRRLAPAEAALASVCRYLHWPVQTLPWRRVLSRRALGPSASQRDELLEYFLQTTGQPELSVLARRALLVHRLDLRAILSEIQQPVLVVCGDCDHVVASSCADELVHGLRHALRANLADCGHMPHYTHPEALAELVREFLTPQ